MYLRIYTMRKHHEVFFVTNDVDKERPGRAWEPAVPRVIGKELPSPEQTLIPGNGLPVADQST